MVSVDQISHFELAWPQLPLLGHVLLLSELHAAFSPHFLAQFPLNLLAFFLFLDACLDLTQLDVVHEPRKTIVILQEASDCLPLVCVGVVNEIVVLGVAKIRQDGKTLNLAFHMLEVLQAIHTASEAHSGVLNLDCVPESRRSQIDFLTLIVDLNQLACALDDLLIRFVIT